MVTQPKTKTRPIKPKRKTNVKVKVKQRARVVKKDTVRKEQDKELPRMQAQPPRTTGAVIKVKVKKKR